MEELKNRLRQLENGTGNEIWQILKESEDDLRQNLVNLNEQKEEKERKGRETLKLLQEKKKELANLKINIEELRNEYKKHISAVETGLKASGLDMKQVVTVFEKVLEDSLSEKRSEITSNLANLDGKSLEEMKMPLKTVAGILSENKDSQLRVMVEEEISRFHGMAVEVCRRELWSFFQKQGLPMKSLDSITLDREKFVEICEFSSDLDFLATGSHSESIPNLLSSAFGHLTNLCSDMVENEQGTPDFEWILTVAHKWALNLKEAMKIGITGLKIDMEKFDETADLKFVAFLHSVTEVFVVKHLNDPLLFSKLIALFRRFEETCKFDLTDKDLFIPLYSPEVMSKWMLLEVELFTFGVSKLLSDPHCLQPLSVNSIGSSTSTWASEATLFFEEWLSRVDRDVSCLGDLEVQTAFYEMLQVLMLDFRHRLQILANHLYHQPQSWSNDVFLVMNSVWELRRLIEHLAVTWPISAISVEKAYEREWERLGDMISEYLDSLVFNSLDKPIRSTYVSSFEKIQLIQESFAHILKCIRNVSQKASQPSRSPLLNKLVVRLFRNFQKTFDRWQGQQSSTVEVLSVFYTHVYSNLVPHLEQLAGSGWKRSAESREEMCRLDALMKSAANKDPSGELVRTAFKSIDEEQVVKMLAELGIYSTSDHAFQDYQILAENWEKVKDTAYDEFCV